MKLCDVWVQGDWGENTERVVVLNLLQGIAG